MSNLSNHFISVICKDKGICKSPKHYCTTCLRNRANNYRDNFSLIGEESKYKYTERFAGVIKNGK